MKKGYIKDLKKNNWKFTSSCVSIKLILASSRCEKIEKGVQDHEIKLEKNDNCCSLTRNGNGKRCLLKRTTGCNACADSIADECGNADACSSDCNA